MLSLPPQADPPEEDRLWIFFSTFLSITGFIFLFADVIVYICRVYYCL